MNKITNLAYTQIICTVQKLKMNTAFYQLPMSDYDLKLYDEIQNTVKEIFCIAWLRIVS